MKTQTEGQQGGTKMNDTTVVITGPADNDAAAAQAAQAAYDALNVAHVCDHGNCPAPAAFVILMPSGVITMCAHHTNDSAEMFAANGYKVLEFEVAKQIALALHAHHTA
jgi:hypothetical protein